MGEEEPDLRSDAVDSTVNQRFLQLKILIITKFIKKFFFNNLI